LIIFRGIFVFLQKGVNCHFLIVWERGRRWEGGIASNESLKHCKLPSSLKKVCIFSKINERLDKDITNNDWKLLGSPFHGVQDP
jgi:hypothetical protein